MRKTLVAGLAGIVFGAVAMVTSGAFAAGPKTGTFNMKAGTSLNVVCPNALTNTAQARDTETLNCAANATTTTTSSPTTTSPPTTTTPPSTTTTSPPTTTTSTTAPPATTTTTTTTTPASGGNCTDPTYSTSNAEGTINEDPGSVENWWVNNDAWNGSHGPQTIYVCNQSSWYATSDQPNDGGAVETYPDTEYDVGGRTAGSTTPISGFSSITSTFSEADPAGQGGWDAAYDLWLNNWSTEIMIWNQWSGTQSYWPGIATTQLTLGGVGYSFYDNGGELMFFRDTQVSSGSVDILAAFQWLVQNGYVASTAVPTQLEYGVEICYTSGTETFPMTGLTFSLDPTP